ncbi:MAG TPA: radical SAM protein [Candidatus Bathyarchaeia archaeon]|nr:radical SAM protein [Candidatus Bathyarchaeia archaeon]
MKMKKVSVIIPITREKLVLKTTKSVRKQDYPELEIVKVKAKRLNPAQARNKGVQKAKGEILLFLDDDCQVRKGWIKENLKALAGDKIGAVGAKIEGKSEKYWAKVADFANFTFTQADKKREMPLCAASLGIRKEVFKKLGGFDESLIIGEDVDLCFRLNRLGLKTLYEPKIKVWHEHKRESLLALLRYQYSNGKVKGLTIEKRYPDNFWFIFLKTIARPWFYWIFVLPFAVLATLIAVGVNWQDRLEVFYLIPGIFSAKLACQLGILANLISHRNHRLRYLTLFVTNQCNLHCRHCFYWQVIKRQKKELSLRQIEALSHDLGKLKLLSISGGEPFLRSDLADIIQPFVANNRLRVVSIVTNGSLPGKIQKEVEKILKISSRLLVVVCLSVDGTEKIHDKIRGFKGSFKKMVKTHRRLRLLKEKYKNLRIRQNATVFNLNYKNLYRLIGQAPKLFPDNYLFSLSLLRGRPRDKDLKLPAVDKLKKLFAYKNKRLKGNRSWLSRLVEKIVFRAQIKTLTIKKQIIPCQAGKLMAVILEDGRVAPCELLTPVGNIKKQSFNEIWQGKKMQDARKRISQGKCFCTQEGFLYLSLLNQPLALLNLFR